MSDNAEALKILNEALVLYQAQVTCTQKLIECLTVAPLCDNEDSPKEESITP